MKSQTKWPRHIWFGVAQYDYAGTDKNESGESANIHQLRKLNDGVRPAVAAITIPLERIIVTGVLVFLFTFPKAAGNRPSRETAKNILDNP